MKYHKVIQGCIATIRKGGEAIDCEQIKIAAETSGELIHGSQNETTHQVKHVRSHYRPVRSKKSTRGEKHHETEY